MAQSTLVAVCTGKEVWVQFPFLKNCGLDGGGGAVAGRPTLGLAG